MVEDLQQKNRMERADKAHLLVKLDLARDELHELAHDRAEYDADPQQDRKAGYQTEHPSVKPITLMEDLCTLVCQRGERILDASVALVLRASPLSGGIVRIADDVAERLATKERRP